nr:outer membrane beta-barrel protein [uncultured Sulfurimonas sp.]
MNNKILSLVVATMLTTGALSAKEVKGDLHVNVSQVEVFKDTNVGYGLGYGYRVIYNSGIYLGGSLDFIASEGKKDALTSKKTLYAYGTNIKLGYVPIKNLAVYGIGSAMLQSIGSLGGAGFGYGGGVEYMFNENFALSAEYITHKMTLEGSLDYDYDIAGVNLKYTF